MWRMMFKMAKYQNKKPKDISESLFKECFGDLSEHQQLKIMESLGGIQEVCKL